jgi:hypothetical protein
VYNNEEKRNLSDKTLEIYKQNEEDINKILNQSPFLSKDWQTAWKNVTNEFARYEKTGESSNILEGILEASGNYVTDKVGEKVTGKILLPIVGKTGSMFFLTTAGLLEKIWNMSKEKLTPEEAKIGENLLNLILYYELFDGINAQTGNPTSRKKVSDLLYSRISATWESFNLFLDK